MMAFMFTLTGMPTKPVINAIELTVKSGDETFAFGMYICLWRLLGVIPGAKICGTNLQFYF